MWIVDVLDITEICLNIEIWATSWENLFMPYANNKGVDQPAHPRSLISAFVIRCLDSIIPLVSISKLSILCLASVAAHARFASTLVANPEDRFSRDEAHLWPIRTCVECSAKYFAIRNLMWATTWQNQQNECAPSEDSDQPGHPPSLIRVFAVRSMGS